MAVFEHPYRRYAGPLTTRWQRFLVVPRYAFEGLLKSRAFILFFLLCMLLPFAGILMIYLRHNVAALNLLGLPVERIRRALPIGAAFFEGGLEIQGFLAFLLAVGIAPSLVSPDLRNNGLALYLSRPFSRAEYVMGKLVVLLALLSTITWVPGLLLYLLQGYLEGGGWFAEQSRVVVGLLVGGGAWIVEVSVLALTVSAWVKWRPVARIVLLILYFVMAAFARISEMALGTWWGGMLSIAQVSKTIWVDLFGLPQASPMPVGAAWFAFVVGSLLSLALLLRRVRAYEVVR